MLRCRKCIVCSGGKKGFTLVELLIVIVVIGVLSAMMMLSSTEAVSSARANNIISNLRNLKTAALSFYTDNMNALVVVSNTGTQLDLSKIPNSGATSPSWLGAAINSAPSIITKYLGDNGNLSINGDTSSNMYCAKGGYAITCADKGKVWYVVYRFADNEGAIKEKINSKAASIGLLGYNSKIPDSTSLTVASNTYNNNNYVLLKVADI